MKIFIIGFYDLLKFSRNKIVVLILLALPIIFSLLVGLIFNNAKNSQDTPKKQVGIENLDEGKYGEDLIKELKKNDTISLKIYEKDKLYKEVENIYIEIGFIIPNNFTENIENSKSPVIKTVKTPTAIDSGAVENIIGNAYNNLLMADNLNDYFEESMLLEADIEFKENVLSELKKNYDDNIEENLIKVTSIWYEGDAKSDNYDGTSQTTIGYIIMFVMFTVILGTGEILEEKKFNTWERLKITPTNNSIIYLGKILGIFLRGAIQIIILILFGYFVLGVSWGNSIPATILILVTFLFCITGLGIFIATLVKTNSQLGALTTIIIVPSTALSGCWWPLFIEPEPMQKLAVIFPQYWTLKGLTNTVVGNLGVSSAINSFLVLIFMTVIFFIMALISDRIQSGKFIKL